MAQRGRKPKPRALKVLDGSGRPNARTRGKTHKGALPPPPDWLDPVARGFWREAGLVLMERGLGTRGDAWSLEGMARLYSRWRQAEAVLIERGSTYVCARTGNPKRRPEALEALQCWTALRLMFNEVGLTPSSLARLGLEGDGEASNPFAEFAS